MTTPRPIKITKTQKDVVLSALNAADVCIAESLRRSHWSASEMGGFSNPTTQLFANRDINLIEAKAKIFGKVVNLQLVNWRPSRAGAGPDYNGVDIGCHNTKGNADAWRKTFRQGMSKYPVRDIIALVAYCATQVSTGYPRSSETAIKCAYANSLLDSVGDAITEFRIDFRKTEKDKYTLPLKGLEDIRDVLRAGMPKWRYLMNLPTKDAPEGDGSRPGLYAV